MVVPKEKEFLVAYNHINDSAIFHVHAEEVSGSSRHQKTQFASILGMKKTQFKKHRMNVIGSTILVTILDK
jgi:hypothetical protein